jgi:hypothetical protein
MKTDALIERLSEDAAPVRAGTVWRALLIGVGAGALVSVAAMVAWLGIRPDLAEAMGTAMYWAKFFYTLLFALFAFLALERLARPGARATLQAGLVALPVLAIAAMGAMRMMRAPAEARMTLVMGASSDVCPWRIAILSLPVFVGAFWALRKLAPTRPVLSGLGAGLMAGALGAFIYAFHCNESASPFIAFWYTLGIAAVGGAGAVLGRLLLKW